MCLDDMSNSRMYAHACIDVDRAAYIRAQVEAEHRRCEHAQAFLMHHGRSARAYNRLTPSVAQGL